MADQGSTSRSFSGLQQKQVFQPLPAPTGQPPYHLALDSLLAADQLQAIIASGKMVLHVAGDTGGVKAPQAQQIVANHMVDDFAAPDLASRPALFYHLGDVVYYYGEAREYYPQFYEPYAHYPAPIVAIPGNHDGDIAPPDPTNPSPPAASLDAFARNFCAAAPAITPEAGDVARDAMTQPNVYFTLDTPFATFIGLYTNVPEGGQLDDTQIAWFRDELRTSPAEKALIVATHHPIYSLDQHHGASAYMGSLLDDAFTATGRIPDLVFSAHVHNYQRFTRPLGGRAVPYIVAGAGGYWNLHYMTHDYGYPIPLPLAVPQTDLTLNSYCDNRHGYMRLTISASTLIGEYFTVPRPQESWGDPAVLLDRFTLDLAAHSVS
jgi:hypothetical protein